MNDRINQMTSFKDVKGKSYSVLLLCIFVSSVSVFGRVNVAEKGADTNGQELCSDLINQVIDSLSEMGGGEVYFPAGKYLCGPIELKSNITLNIDAGAVLTFTDDFNEYLPLKKSRWEGVRVYTFQSPISAYNADNITIKGRGLIDGNGKKWWDFWFSVKGKDKGDDSMSEWESLFYEQNKELIHKNAYLQKMGNFLRPPLLMPYECTNVRIEGVSFTNPPFWTIMPTFCDNVTIDGITINNPGHSPNTDGIDPSSCTNVHISNSHITVGDDCIVIKSGRDEDGREAGKPTENITITNCTMLNGHGGVVIGSEMSGSVRRVAISNCVFQGTDRGIRIKTMRGRGGVVEDVTISNIVMYDIVKEGIMMNMRYHSTPVEEISERTPAIRNISIDNVRIHNADRGIAFYGLEERGIENIQISGVNIVAERGICGYYAHHIDLNNIRVEAGKEIPVLFEDSKDIRIENLSVRGENTKSGAIYFHNVESALVSNCFQTYPLPYFIKCKNTSDIYLSNNVLPGVEELLGDSKEKVKENNNIIGKR